MKCRKTCCKSNKS